jgi:hypothetical protein
MEVSILNEDIIEAVNEKLFSEINKAKGLIHSAEACIANKQYTQCAERLQCVGVTFTAFELAVFEAAK